MDWEALDLPIARNVHKWGRDAEYTVTQLKQAWGEVARETWMRRVEPIRIDRDRTLVVVVQSSSVRMELQRRGARWQALLDSVCEVSGLKLADMIVEQHTGRRR